MYHQVSGARQIKFPLVPRSSFPAALGVKHMRNWHREDIFLTLIGAGWSNPIVENNENYFVGEAYSSKKGAKSLHLLFVCDLGEGYTGLGSIEEVVAIDEKGRKHELWLDRRRDNKWRVAVSRWAKEL